jgi:hypothetical protein
LSFGGRFNQLTLYFKACSNCCVGNLCEIWHWTINNNLKSRSTTTIGEFNEAKIFTTHSCGAGPTCNLNNVVEHLFVLWCCECSNSNTLSKWEGCNCFVFNGVVSNKVDFIFSFVSRVLWTYWWGSLFSFSLSDLRFLWFLCWFSSVHYRVKISDLIVIEIIKVGCSITLNCITIL